MHRAVRRAFGSAPAVAGRPRGGGTKGSRRPIRRCSAHHPTAHPLPPVRSLAVWGGSRTINGPASALSSSLLSTSAWNPVDPHDDHHSESSRRGTSRLPPPSRFLDKERGGGRGGGSYHHREGEPIESQLERFFQSPSPRFSKKHVRDLVNGSCRMNTLRGMQLAHDVVEKWIVVSSMAATNDDKSSLDPPMDVAYVAITTLELWQQVLYGWSVVAHNHPVAVVRMKEVVDRVVREAKRSSTTRPSSSSSTAAATETESRGSWRTAPPPANAPTVDLFNTYLFGMAQASKSSRSSADAARAVLADMEKLADGWGWWCRPNTKSYMSVLVAYRNGRVPHAGEAVVEILDHMIRAHHAQRQQYEAQYGEPYRDDDEGGKNNRRKIVTPDQRVFTVALEAVIQSVGDTRKYLRHLLANLPTQLGVDAKFWVSVIHAHARLVDQEGSAAGRVEIARDAERVLRDAFPSGTTRDDDDDLATVRAAWNACLDTWSRVYAAEAPVECERILQEMLGGEEAGAVPPDTVSFNSCHYAWSKASETNHHDNAWERSMELLQLQIDLNEASTQPDFQTYALVVLACGNAGRLSDARAVLDGMVARTRGLGSPLQRNAAAPFSALLSAIAKRPENVDEPSSATSDANAWEAEDGTDSLYDVALQTYAEVVQDLHGIGATPDHHTYSAMLRCIAAHAGTGVERQTRAREVFDAACEAGEVSRAVVEALEAAIGQADARLWLGDLPRFWSRNVPVGFRGHSRRQGGAKGPKSSRRSGGNSKVQRLDS